MGKNLIKKDLINLADNPVGIKDDDVIPADLMRQLEDKIPPWLKEYENDGSAILRWNFEYSIFLMELLRYNFDFSEDDIDKLDSLIKEWLPKIKLMKAKLPRLLTKQDFNLALEMVARNKKLLEREKSGIYLPKDKGKELK